MRDHNLAGYLAAVIMGAMLALLAAASGWIG